MTKENIITATAFKKARKNAGHSQIQASVSIGVGNNMIVDIEKRNVLPKEIYRKEIIKYINKHT